MIELTFKIEATPEAMRAMGRRFLAWADADDSQEAMNGGSPMSTAIMNAGPPLAESPAPPAPPTPVQTLPDPPSVDSSPPLEFPSTPAIEAPETDARGLPWDVRIHASTKAKTKPGDWRTKRGVDPALVAQVEAELKSKLPSLPVMHVDTGAGVQPPPTTEVQPPPTTEVQPPPTTAEPSLPAPESFGQMTFALLAKHVSDLRTKGDITDEFIDSVCKSQGIVGFTMAAGLPPDNLMAFYREVYNHVQTPTG